MQINAGGPAVTPFVADAYYSGGSTASTSNAIDTSGVTNPAPQAVYQSNRYGNFTYTIPNLTAGAAYTVRLHFAETYWSAAGKRVFNVSINGQQVLTNFDIYAAAGGANKAVVREASATATGSGTITIQFSTVVDNAQVNGLEILPAGGTVRINAGGPAVTPFVADAYYSGGSTASTSNAIDTSGVTNPAPQAVYQSNRYGNFTYTIPNLTAGAAYTVRLHFAETYWSAAGKRVFNVSINGQQVLTNFDIYAAAGGANKAVVREMSATATGSGTITIQFSTVVDNAQVNGLEILPAAGGTPTPTPTPAAGVVRVNAGGPAVTPFVADAYYSGGSTASTSNAIDTSGVTNPAPQAVYQSNRYGNFTYTIPNLTAGAAYTVRLHFAETYWSAAGKRVFNVSINGQQV
ncbi:MAG: hypothetical protein IRZ24_10490, partial [Thermogemmatispora sp.]|uniref:malectin domain-containing carbohydrate-binding protein n=1 Tax=Thermogemmatispora sp. TaxID=1968838 RepID=UPI001D8CDE27